ncbi:MAG: hypothetical protein KGL10_00550 [Alphaproteobacteria bacterium]|nr:hypothetical protein [Alphaproteobacteria bacterium]MDE2335782.1 hypothetical protein [Alphaproteobacteria bacterium]
MKTEERPAAQTNSSYASAGDYLLLPDEDDDIDFRAEFGGKPDSDGRWIYKLSTEG